MLESPRAAPGDPRGEARAGGESLERPQAYSLSMIVPVPSPPPQHIEISP